MKREYSITIAVIVFFGIAFVGERAYYWWNGPRRVGGTETTLRIVTNGFAKNERYVVERYEKGGYVDGWDVPIQKEAADGGIRFRSAGPDGSFGTDDDIVGETHPEWTPPPPAPTLMERAKKFIGLGN